MRRRREEEYNQLFPGIPHQWTPLSEQGTARIAQRRRLNSRGYVPPQPMLVQTATRTFSNKRPVDKAIIVVNKDAVDATQVSTVLVTATFPCTMTGLRWDLSFFADAGTAISEVSWAILLVKQGNTVSTLTTSDGGTLHDPEQNVLTFGYSALAPGDGNQNPVTYNNTTKSMRKLMGGDRIYFIMKGIATNTVGVRGAIQFFCKS